MQRSRQTTKTNNWILGTVSLTSIITCNILAAQGESTAIITTFAVISIITLLMTD